MIWLHSVIKVGIGAIGKAILNDELQYGLIGDVYSCVLYTAHKNTQLNVKINSMCDVYCLIIFFLLFLIIFYYII